MVQLSRSPTSASRIFAGAEDEKAIEHLGAALRLRPDLDRLHLLLGELYARTDREKAREHYERFIRIADYDDPDAQKAAKSVMDARKDTVKELLSWLAGVLPAKKK